MVVVESTAILRQRIQLPPQTTPRPSVNTMTVRRAQHIRPSFMNGRVDHVRRRVQQPVLSTIDDFARVVDEDEVGLGHQAESAPEGVYPEAVWVHGVAERDVARYTFVEAVFAEDAEGGGEAAFEVVAFGVFVGEGWGAGEEMLLARCFALSIARWGSFMVGWAVMR